MKQDQVVRISQVYMLPLADPQATIETVGGCGDATMRLKTGDRIRVDGGKGLVEIISAAQK